MRPTRLGGLGSGVVLRVGWLAVALLAVGCAEEAPPADESPLVLEVFLTYHRGEEPVSVSRDVPLPPRVAEGGLSPRLALEVALEALVAGPTEGEGEDGVHSFFSDETSPIVRSVEIRERTAVVDFEDFRPLMPGASSSAGGFMLLAELNGTVFANAPVDEVEYRLEGSCDAFWAFLQRACTVVPQPQAERREGTTTAQSGTWRSDAQPE